MPGPSPSCPGSAARCTCSPPPHNHQHRPPATPPACTSLCSDLDVCPVHQRSPLAGQSGLTSGTLRCSLFSSRPRSLIRTNRSPAKAQRLAKSDWDPLVVLSVRVVVLTLVAAVLVVEPRQAVRGVDQRIRHVLHCMYRAMADTKSGHQVTRGQHSVHGW